MPPAEKSPGIRVRMLRVLLGISREEFCVRYDLNINTLTSIELGRLKISDKQLKKLSHAFQKEGLKISEGWLSDPLSSATSMIHGLSWMSVEKEVIPLSSYKNFVSICIQEDDLFPFYAKGDFVCGLWSDKTDVFMDQLCLVRIDPSHIKLGLLEKRGEALYLTNPLDKKTYALPEPVQCAFIVYHIKQGPSGFILSHLKDSLEKTHLFANITGY